MVRLLGSFLFAAAVATVPSPALAAPAPSERIVSGAATKDGASLVAGDHGVTYELAGGVLVSVSSGAEFAFDPPLHMKLGKPSDPASTVRPIKLTKGSVEVTIPDRPAKPTAVMFRGSSKLSAVIKEGHGAFVVEGARTTAASRDGEQLIGVGNDWKPLRGGVARTLAPEDPTASPHPILPAPSPRFDRALVLLKDGDTGVVDTRWAAVAGAVRYTVDLIRVEGAKRESVASQTTNGTAASIGPVKPGSYAVEVRAVDRSGLASPVVNAPTARVVGISVPEGASVAADGTVILGKDQRLSLLGAQGVEVSFGTSPTFIPAPPTLGMAHGAVTIARLRAAGSKDEALVRLSPKGLRARVSIGPRRAKWPADAVTIEVEAYDESGQEVPEGIALDTTVTVNLTPAKMSWRRSGRKLTATLPAGTPPGPWIVRVEVKDASGELLGYDFLEVSPSGGARHAVGLVAER